MNIKLLNLELSDFKGLRDFTFCPGGKNAIIRGANGTGKSTVMTAFLWLLTGKDAQGRSDFNIFPVGADGKRISGCFPEVTASLTIAAVKKYCADIENSLWQIALLINEAVAFECVMHGIDISDKVPRYPLTAQKIGMIAKANELNADETVQAITDELLECQGSQKNVTAGELKAMAEKML